MTTLLWDQVGERFYEEGVDRGVLYLPNGGAVPWNGLISVDEQIVSNESTPVHFDGVKYGDSVAPGDFAANLSAYTYPDEFLDLEGISEIGNGLYLGNQYPQRFGLSYRTRVGNDEDSDLGYKIHVVYNATAVSTQKSYKTSTGQDPSSFQWTITAVPGEIPGYRSTAHLIFDTRQMNALLISDIEATLYGDGISIPELPPISSLVSFVDNWVIIRITDNFDGTWTAEGPDDMITMLDAQTFQIAPANAVYLDADTYVISNTTH